MAYGLIPFEIPKRADKKDMWGRIIQVKPYAEKDFQESEKLKLRALKLVDRLGSETHIRRKAHRDLALWYMMLGKNELYEKEKQTLFKLVGVESDRLLFPQATVCGRETWWESRAPLITRGCGMG